MKKQQKQKQRIMTGRNIPKDFVEVLKKELGLPGIVQSFSLFVDKNQVVQVKCAYIPFVKSESSEK